MASSYEVDSTSDCVASLFLEIRAQGHNQRVCQWERMFSPYSLLATVKASTMLVCLAYLISSLVLHSQLLLLKYQYYTSLKTYRVCILFLVYNYIPLAQVYNARITRHFYFLKGRLHQTNKV